MTYPQWLLNDFRDHLSQISGKLAEILAGECVPLSPSEPREHDPESAQPEQQAHPQPDDEII
jgi:hypothetical protein